MAKKRPALGGPKSLATQEKRVEGDTQVQCRCSHRRLAFVVLRGTLGSPINHQLDSGPGAWWDWWPEGACLLRGHRREFSQQAERCYPMTEECLLPALGSHLRWSNATNDIVVFAATGASLMFQDSQLQDSTVLRLPNDVNTSSQIRRRNNTTLAHPWCLGLTKSREFW